jgi:hypothetical protein
MFVKFKKDFVVPINNVDDKYIDNTFIFKRNYVYRGYIKDNHLIVETNDTNLRVELDELCIKDYIEELYND